MVAVKDSPTALAAHPATDEVFVGTANGALALLDTQSDESPEQPCNPESRECYAQWWVTT
jgi:hypothetical protein